MRNARSLFSKIIFCLDTRSFALLTAQVSASWLTSCRIVLILARWIYNSIHLVLPNLFGPRDHFDIIRSHALGALIRKVSDAQRDGAETVEIWGTGKPVREWMYVEDAAEGILRATESYNGIGILNLGCGQGISIRDLAEMVREEAGWKGSFQYDTSRPDGALCKIIDVTRMRRALDGWMPPTPFREGIAKTIKWYSDHCHEYAACATADH